MSSETEIIKDILDLGGLLTGGAAVALMFEEDFAKDLDFFFKDKKSLEKAKKLYKKHDYLDLCPFSEDNPYDTFDLDISQCFMGKDGVLHKSKKCDNAFNTKTISLIRENVITPRVTLFRLYKYSSKYGLAINDDDILFLKSQF